MQDTKWLFIIPMGQLRIQLLPLSLG